MTSDEVHRIDHSGKLVVDLDQGELAVRLIEAAWRTKRPHGKSVSECLDATPDEERSQFLRMAKTAIFWFAECYNKGTRLS